MSTDEMKTEPLSCDFPAEASKSGAASVEHLSETRLHKFEGNKPETGNQSGMRNEKSAICNLQSAIEFTWSGVEPQSYKPPSEDWASVVRHVIVGSQGEETRFHVRYFEIAPGGYTSLEKHQHAHVVIGVRGKAKMIAGIECYELNFLDTIYIAPNTPHQLVNDADEPFGFFCLVDAERDRPQPLTADELEAIKTSPRTQHIVRC